MPISNQVIITTNTISSCTPVNLELTCGSTGCSIQHYLNFSDDPIILKRNGVTKIQNATFCIETPAYLGCNKIPFNDGKNLNTDFFLEEIPHGAGATLTDIGLDGSHLNSVPFNIKGDVSANEYSYTISWDFTTELDISEFKGCNMILQFMGNSAPCPNLNNSKTLTKQNGFPLCNSFEDEYDSLHGYLTFFGTSD